VRARPNSEPPLWNAALVIQRLAHEQTNLLINEHISLLQCYRGFFYDLVEIKVI